MQYWVAVTGGILAGIVAETAFAFQVPFVMLLIVVALALLLLATMRKSQAALLVAVGCLAAGAAAQRTDMTILTRNPELDALVGKQVQVVGKVVAEPDVRSASVRIEISVESVEGVAMHSEKDVLVQLPLYADVTYGDRVSVAGKLELPKNFDTQGREFDYVRYLETAGIGYTMSFAKLADRQPLDHANFFSIAFAIKHWFADGINAALSEPAAGLARGMLLGDKRALGDALYQAFITTGLVHIIVLSGFNITVVATGLTWLLRGFDRRFRFLGIILSGIFFVIITGFAASSIRAAVMAGIVTLAQVTKRAYQPTRALCIAISGMLMWHPQILLHDPGFQLSILATLGLMYIAPHFERFFSRWLPPGDALGFLSTTLAAYVATLPFILYAMGTWSLVAIPANLLVLPAVMPAMLLSFIAGSAGVLSGYVGVVVGAPAFGVLTYIITVAEWMSRVPFASIPVPVMPGWLLYGMYALIVVTIVALQQQKPPREIKTKR